jgi:hypothetical protein
MVNSCSGDLKMNLNIKNVQVRKKKLTPLGYTQGQQKRSTLFDTWIYWYILFLNIFIVLHNYICNKCSI